LVLPSLTDIVVVIVLLVPGFISFTLFKRISVIEKRFSDLETTIWSLFSSLVIIMFFGLITGINSIDTIRDRVFLPEHLMQIILLAILLGAIPGLIIKFTIRKGIYPGDCWELVMEKIGKRGGYVIVYTGDGLEYKGILHYYTGRGEGKKELTIRKPKLILRGKNWNVIEEIEVGKEILFTEKDVKRVVFFREV